MTNILYTSKQNRHINNQHPKTFVFRTRKYVAKYELLVEYVACDVHKRWFNMHDQNLNIMTLMYIEFWNCLVKAQGSILNKVSSSGVHY